MMFYMQRKEYKTTGVWVGVVFCFLRFSDYLEDRLPVTACVFVNPGSGLVTFSVYGLAMSAPSPQVLCRQYQYVTSIPWGTSHYWRRILRNENAVLSFSKCPLPKSARHPEALTPSGVLLIFP